MSLRIVLVDDHPVVRAGLRALLSAQPDLDVVAEAASGPEALAVVRSSDPDVVLMDLQLDGVMDGVEATRRLLAADPGRRVLILTTYDTDHDILRAVEAGAAGYLLKDVEPARLADGVRAAARGETVLAPVVAQRLVSRLAGPTPDQLTPREVEVLQLVADGSSNREVARHLFLSEATVKTHLAHAYDKLGAQNRTAAVAAARSRGIVR